MQETRRILETAKYIVLSAGKYIRSRLGGNFQTGYKSCPADLVTEVDRNSQAIIMEALSRHYPDHRLVAEEDSCEVELTPDEQPVWFIDPLDGTTNFVFGIPFCAVNVAMSVKGSPVLGVTYDPFREELFSAVRGGGSHLNGKSIQVDGIRNRVAESLIVTGFPSLPHFKDEMWKADYKKIFYKAVDVRAFGSAALELAYIACGRLTGYWEVTLRPWDVAAGILLVEEAGGKVSDLCGEKLELGRHISIAASNGLIHDELIADLGYEKGSKPEV
ncbi:MAG: inositol monophosphatase family protein [Bacillota bacterium]